MAPAALPRRSRTARAVGLAVVGALVLGAASCGGNDGASDTGERGFLPVLATWSDGVGVTSSGRLIQGQVSLAAGTRRVEVDLANAAPVSIPDPCVQSTVRALKSYIDGGKLLCDLDGATTSLRFLALVSGVSGTRVTGTVTTSAPSGPGSGTLPGRSVVGGTPLTPDLRLLSSPDFLNADVGDLRKGPNRWNPGRSTNSTNPAYESVIGGILDDWASLEPAAVLVAGDLVDGRWGFDDQHTGNFGPVATTAERENAVRLAARTYYPQWQQRFTDHGLAVYPTVGDHDVGDNPWGANKRALVPTYRQEFAREFSYNADGTPRYTDHPRGPAAHTAFAARPRPDVQIISLDVFDITRKHARIRLDHQQLQWLRAVLTKANADKVKWIIVESHVPVIFPVRSHASSRLHYENGVRSNFWKILRHYGVDLYLCGEVHDTQLAENGGIVQVSHGGAFQFGLTTAMTLDFYGDNLYLQLRDYDVKLDEHGGPGTRLWETRRDGMPADISTGHPPYVIGTATISGRQLADTSGILTPVP